MGQKKLGKLIARTERALITRSNNIKPVSEFTESDSAFIRAFYQQENEMKSFLKRYETWILYENDNYDSLDALFQDKRKQVLVLLKQIKFLNFSDDYLINTWSHNGDYIKAFGGFDNMMKKAVDMEIGFIEKILFAGNKITNRDSTLIQFATNLEIRNKICREIFPSRESYALYSDLQHSQLLTSLILKNLIKDGIKKIFEESRWNESIWERLNYIINFGKYALVPCKTTTISYIGDNIIFNRQRARQIFSEEK